MWRLLVECYSLIPPLMDHHYKFLDEYDSCLLLQERGYSKTGRPEEAAIAGGKAGSLEKAYFK